MKYKFIVIVFLFVSHVYAQEHFVVDNNESNTTIIGTSDLHDWETDVEKISGKATLKPGKGDVLNIEAMEIIYWVKSFKSGKKTMDELTYEALREEKYPKIIYSINPVEIKGNINVAVLGNLTIAGVTREITVNGSVTNTGSELNITGEHTFNMTDFNIDPPTAMFGTISTDDQITIAFDLRMVPEE